MRVHLLEELQPGGHTRSGMLDITPSELPLSAKPRRWTMVPALTDHRRADIDGLRAVAVLAVVAFHAFPNALRGGFVGVDVFFFISGYLISGIILDGLASGRFNFLDFYARRARRIFPALLCVLSSMMVFGFCLLERQDWLALLRQMLAGCGFVSNFLFWHQSGYFDRQAIYKPLLHLWSLAIEEQFYLLWPALLWLAVRARCSGWLIGLVAVGSFVCGVVLTRNDATAAFYSPLTRCFGLSIGALLAWWQCRTGLQASGLFRLPGAPELSAATARLLADGLGFGGAALIAGAFVFCSQQRAFPGFAVLAPTLGAAALVAAGPQSYLNRNLLAHPLAVAIGALSYPLYLWHWPLLSLANSLNVVSPSASLRWALLLLAFFLAWVTYVGVEIPLRGYATLNGAARGATLGMVGMAGCAALLLALSETYDLQAYLRTPAERTLRESNRHQLTWFDVDPNCLAAYGLQKDASSDEALFCSIGAGSGPPTVVVFGDSTANALFPGLARVYGGRHERVMNVGNGTCAPFRDLQGHFTWNRYCADVNRTVYERLLADSHVQTVVLSFAPWDIKNMRFAGVNGDSDVAAQFRAIAPLVRRDIAALQRSGKRVIATFDTPKVGIDPNHCLRSSSNCEVPVTWVNQNMEPYLTQWHSLLAGIAGVCVFDQQAVFRVNDSYAVAMRGELLFRDDHHLSYFGSDTVADYFRKSACF